MYVTNELEQLGLKDQTIRHLFVDVAGEYLRFVTDTTEFFWCTDADCCSVTWFSDILNLHRLIGFPILGATEFSPTPIEDDRCRQEVDSFYGIRISTTRGTSSIIYRNSSNGYYGGSIHHVPAGNVKRSDEREVIRDGPLDWQLEDVQAVYWELMVAVNWLDSFDV